MITTERLSELFVEVADTLVDDFDLIDFFHTLVVQAADIGRADAAGLLLNDQQGHLQLVASTDSSSELLELYQLQNSEGPCLDCFATGQAIINADLTHVDQTWPVFATRAVELGYRSVHAFPMRLRTDVIGTLNLFGAADTPLEPTDTNIVQALADIATIAILQERSVTRAEALTEQLQGALNSRIVIEQAKGAIAKIAGVNVDEAFTLLRTHARSTGQRLGTVAEAVLAGSHDPFTRLEGTVRSTPE